MFIIWINYNLCAKFLVVVDFLNKPSPRYRIYALETAVWKATITIMPVIRLIIISLAIVQLSFSKDPNWRVLRIIEQTQPFKPLNSIYRKQAVKVFWSEHARIMEDITRIGNSCEKALKLVNGKHI